MPGRGSAVHATSFGNPSPHLLSYCPCFFLSVVNARRESALPPDVTGGAKGSPRSGLTFASLTLMNVTEAKSKIACPGVILSIHFRVMNRRPYKEQRTSCVLCIPRILTDARYPQHAWQGFQPVHPTKERERPLCWILPLRATGGRA